MMNGRLDGSQELIVVDNASSDSPGEAAAEWKGKHRFIGLAENVGFGAANNVGVGEVTGEATGAAEPRHELLDDGLDRLAAAALELGGLVGPRVLNRRRLGAPSASGPEVGPWPWVRALVPAAVQPGRAAGPDRALRLERRLEVTWLRGACVAGPTGTLARLGPFDRPCTCSCEDVDLGLRAAGAGRAVVVRPAGLQIVHHGQGSTTVAYGSREAWRATGTLNWRARPASRLRAAPRVSGLARPAHEPASAPDRKAAAPTRHPIADRAAVEAVVTARPVPELPR